MKPEQERLSTVLKDTISLLCKNSLSFDKQIMVQGIIAITVDKEDVVVVQVNDYMGLPNYEPCVACGKRDPRPAELDTPSRKRACSPSSQDSRRHSKTPRSDHSSAQSPYHDADSDPDEDTSRVSVKKEVDTDDEDLILIDSEIKGENVDYSDSLNNFNMSYGGGGGGGGEEAPFITGYLDNSQISGITASSTPGGSQLQQPGNLAWAQQQQGGSMSQGDGGGGQTQTQSSIGDDGGDGSLETHCTTCGQKFPSRHDFLQHRQEVHVRLENRTFQCPVHNCGKLFKRHYTMKVHYTLAHTASKRYGCSQCDYRTDHKGNYVRHLQNKHPSTTQGKREWDPTELQHDFPTNQPNEVTLDCSEESY